MGKAFLEERPVTSDVTQLLFQRKNLKKNWKKMVWSIAEHPVLPYAYELTNYDYLAGLLSFQKGYFYIQDISSMQVAEWAEPKEGDYVIDVCAAPGGKAIQPCGKVVWNRVCGSKRSDRIQGCVD